MESIAIRPEKKRGALAKSLAQSRLEIVSPADTRNVGEPWTETALETSHAVVSVRQTYGKSLPVLLLHGNSSGKDIFRHQMNSRIGAQYRLIAIDLPGHGHSSDAFDPARSYTLEGFADVALEVLEQLGIERAVVLGWSLGGHIGLQMTTTFPGLIGLMITGTPPVPNTPEGLQQGFRPHPDIRLIGSKDLTEEQISTFATLTLGRGVDETSIAAMRRADGRARARVFEHFLSEAGSDQRQIAEKSTIPLAVVNGAEDPIVATEYLTGLSYAKLWDRRCYLVPRTGHAPFLEAPEVFNQILGRFLRRMEGRLKAQLNHGSLCFAG